MTQPLGLFLGPKKEILIVELVDFGHAAPRHHEADDGLSGPRSQAVADPPAALVELGVGFLYWGVLTAIGPPDWSSLCSSISRPGHGSSQSARSAPVSPRSRWLPLDRQ